MFRNIEILGTSHPVVGLLIAIGIAINIFILPRLADTKKWFSFKEVLIIVVWMCLGYSLGGRLGQLIIYDHFQDKMGVYGGSSFLGGITFLLLMMPFLSKLLKKNISIVSDFSLYGLCLTQIFGKLGCFCAGCCYGKPTDIFFAVKFSDNSYAMPKGVGLHPTQLYEGICIILIYILINNIIQKKNAPGLATSIYLITYGIERFVVEFYRGDSVVGLMGFTSGQLAAGLLVCIGTFLYLVIGKNRNKFVVSS